MKNSYRQVYIKFSVLSSLTVITLMFQNCAPAFKVEGNAPTQQGTPSSGGQETGGGTSAPAVSSACQSETLCVHEKMPLWSQADGSTQNVLQGGTIVSVTLNLNKSKVPLLKYVQDKGYPVTKDPGWCGATVAAMILNTLNLELDARNEAKISSYPWIGSSEPSEIIFESMGLLGMNPLLGATSPDAIRSGFEKIKTARNVGLVASEDSMISVADFRAAYKKPFVTLAIGSKLGGAHIVALNGTDGQYYVIFDPWGSSYSVSAKAGSVVTQTLPPDNRVFSFTEYFLTYIGPGIKTLEGVSSGFIPTYGTTGKLTSIRYQDY